MAKLLVIGLGPLMEGAVRRFGGQCLRTEYFVRPLLDDGHSVRLVTLPIYDPDDKTMEHAALVRRALGGFEYQAFTNCDFDFIHETLTQVARSFQPDAVVAVNTLPAWVAARLPIAAPLWADLNGYEMAEKQGQAARTGDDAALVEAWRKETLIARRADKLSTVSRPQLHALLGEMALLGRLNRHTFHYHFVHHIPNAWHAAFAAPPTPGAPAIVRGKVTPADAFIVLWSGGYNYWTDPRALAEFVETMLEGDERIHYVSTGGGIAGYNTQTYEEFRALAEASPRRERIHLLGWVEAGDLPAIYREADLGLNMDEPNYETFFGARNRLNNLMAAGLPVLTTAGSEIAQLIEEAGGGVVCASGDTGAMARAVLELAREPARLRRMGERAREFMLKVFAPEVVTAPVREWARRPALAPDNAEKMRLAPDALSPLDVRINYLDAVASVVERHDPLALERAQADLNAIRSKGWYRTLKAIKDAALTLIGRRR